MRYLNALLIIFALLLASCDADTARPTATTESSTVTEEPPEEVDPQWLRLGVDAAGVNTLDPHKAASRQERIIVDMVFNGLVRYNPGNMVTLEPDLAIEIPEPMIVDGKQVWEFNLRQGIMCQAGPSTPTYELTSEDVVYSLQKAADATRSAYAAEYDGMTFEAIDTYTISITLDTPQSIYIFIPKVADYSGGFIICKKAYEAMGDDVFSRHPVGTGPFVFQEYFENQKIIFAANTDYFRGQPHLLGVEVNFLPVLEDREDGLASGDLDVIVGSNAPNWTDNWISPETQVDIIGVGQPVVLYFDPMFTPLGDERVRKAIAYTIDRDELLALFNPLTAKNIFSIVPPEFLPGGLTQEEVEALGLAYTQDLDKARELLNDAGYPNGFTLPVVASKLEVLQKIYDDLKSQLDLVGIELEIEYVAHADWHPAIRQDQSALVVYGAWRPNADVYLTQFFHSNSIVVTGSSPDTNFSHYDQIDDLIVDARHELNPNLQVQLWKQAQVTILSDMAALPLHYQNLVYVRRTNVEYGYVPIASLALYPQFNELTRITP